MDIQLLVMVMGETPVSDVELFQVADDLCRRPSHLIGIPNYNIGIPN